MRFQNKFRFICLLIALSWSKSFAQMPVLLMANRSEQADTLGCNIVSAITGIVYEKICDGSLKLWDTQKKEIPISASTLKSIEKSSGVSFTEQETIFIYEIWNKGKKEITTETVGFSFIHKRGTSEEVLFGFADYKDVADLFSKERINANASGCYSATFSSVLDSKGFNYSIVQFGDRLVRTANESQDLKISYVHGMRFNASKLGYYPPDKSIIYIIDSYTDGTETTSVNSRKIYKSLEEYFVRNQEVFFNMGGDRFMSHLNKNKFKVTRIEVSEIWRKVGSDILYEPRHVTIFVNDSALNQVSAKNIADFEYRFGEDDMFSLIRSKNFDFIITKINSEEIKRKDAYLFYKGLTSDEWNKLNRYVHDYE